MKSIQAIRADFPILERNVKGHPLIYFDNAATSQTPKPVIDTIVHYYSHTNANIHRGAHTLSQEATEAYEQARVKVQKYFNATKACEILFTAGTTHGINLVAHGFGSLLKQGDEIIVSASEHHSNIVPWQFACERSGATLKVITMDVQGHLNLRQFEALLTPQTRLVCVQHVSNALGNIQPIEKIIALAQKVNAAVLIDGAQATPHLQPDVQALDVDFYTASGHKMYGPTGIGILYGKEKWLNKLPPYQGGGEMIKEVAFEGSTYAELPHKFEAGTPNICGAIALGAAIDYMQQIGVKNIAHHEHQLLQYATEKLQALPEVVIYGTPLLENKTAVISFNIKGIHPYDVGTLLDQQGIAVRTGHHCTQPIMDFYQIPGTVRISFAMYNTFDEIDRFIEALLRAKSMLS